MNKNIMFKLRMSEEERRQLAAVAKQMRRSQSDAIRFLVTQAVKELEVAPQK